jgi:hypothetical protein
MLTKFDWDDALYASCVCKLLASAMAGLTRLTALHVRCLPIKVVTHA